MPRGLDHIVHAVRDLDAAAELYRRFGFTVGARNRHPWGTHNHVVQMPGFFIELLTFAEPGKLGDDGFSKLFAAYNRDFITRGQGFSLLLLESDDAGADERAFRAADIAQSDIMRFEREARRPDGSVVTVAFSLVFARNRGSPHIHFATCQQHFPEHFWNPAFQNHRNGACGVAGVDMVAERPGDHIAFLGSFADAQIAINDRSIVAPTPRGDITVLDPVAFRKDYGLDGPPVGEGARLGALRLGVADLAKAVNILRDGGIPFATFGRWIVVAPEAAMGATIAFEQAS
jgi:catechol 2,3-dioxygenase-like lactoylglutathione lyase family enzyme